MTEINNQKNIVHLIEGLKSQMNSFGYKSATITRYDAVWKGLIVFCNENYEGEFTLEAGRNYVWSRYGSQLGDDDTSKNVNRAILLLDDYQTMVPYSAALKISLKSSRIITVCFSPDFLNI